MGILGPFFWILAVGIAAGVASIALCPVEVRRAALFAMPQRRSLARSRFISRNGMARRIYERIWPSKETFYSKGIVDLETLDPAVIEQSALVRRKFFPRLLKRSMDLVLATLLLVFLSPLILIVAIAVRLDSEGPSFYRQTRVGLNGKPITVIKFRTMIQNAESNGAQWAEHNDPRITPLGRFLRKTRIDEIPQAWPILTGKMSFVGPRPERPEFTGELAESIEHYDLRHSVKPGLTGWAQVLMPYTASVEDTRRKLSFDLYYVQHQSALLDWFIVIKTLRVALLGVGSR